MDELKISWKSLNLLRLSLGLLGILGGMFVGFIFVTVWHWVAVFAMFMFSFKEYGWVYLWDILFVVLLLWEGYRYKGRMPPPSPFTNQEAFLTKVVVGVGAFTPQQATYSVSEILYVAPRIFFWGFHHLRRITWPSHEMIGLTEQIYIELKTARRAISMQELKKLASCDEEEAAQAVATLINAELAQAKQTEDDITVRVSQPEWV